MMRGARSLFCPLCVVVIVMMSWCIACTERVENGPPESDGSDFLWATTDAFVADDDGSGGLLCVPGEASCEMAEAVVCASDGMSWQSVEQCAEGTICFGF